MLNFGRPIVKCTPESPNRLSREDLKEPLVGGTQEPGRPAARPIGLELFKGLDASWL